MSSERSGCLSVFGPLAKLFSVKDVDPRSLTEPLQKPDPYTQSDPIFNNGFHLEGYIDHETDMYVYDRSANMQNPPTTSRPS